MIISPSFATATTAPLAANGAQPPRAWSAYDFIHSRRRNKLAPARARDLVYVFTNKRLVRKMGRAEGEAFIPWDEEEEQLAEEGEEEPADQEAHEEEV